MNGPCSAPRQRGLGAITVIVVLVVLAGLAAAVVRLSSTAASSQAQDVASTRAWLAARAGTDWGLYKALKGGWSTCSGASQTLDLRADTGMRVTVTCNSQTWVDGQDANGADRSVRLFTIEATACNGSSGSCPDDNAATTRFYIERKRLVQVMR